MFYREACSKDIDSIMEVENEAFIKEITEKTETFMERINCFSKGFRLLIDDEYHCNVHNSVAGYYCCEIWNHIPQEKKYFLLDHNAQQSHQESGCVLYISSIAVKSKYRGKGYGKKMFYDSTKTVLELYPHIKDIVLLVNSQWKSAIHIYKSYGFEQYGVLTDFFPTEIAGKYSDGLLFRADREYFIGENK